MLRRALLLFVALTSVTMAMANGHVVTIKDFVGRWQITDVVGYAGTGGGIPLAKALLGQTVTITATSIDINGQLCEPSDGLKVRRVETAKMLAEKAGAQPEDAELPRRVWMLDSSACAPIFLLAPHRIEIDVMGVFVRAYRTK